LTGYLISGAPPLRQTQHNQESIGCSRLKVLRNGTLDTSAAVTVTRAEVKHLIKEFIHCTNIKYRQFEFSEFLETCTHTLNLPNAARRVFDHEGIEHFDLAQLKQDQLIYVSMGEPWLPPKMLREEQERKVLLTNLNEDLSKIAHFIGLKNCLNFVIEASNTNVQDGTKLVLGTCCLSFQQIDRIKQGESINNVIDVEKRGGDEGNEDDLPK
jgi:hypothetical protein